MSIKNVGKVGYGLMRLTSDPSKKFTQDEFNQVLKTVIDNRGYSEPLFLNGGEFYGVPEPHENITKIGEFFRTYPDYADHVYLSVKGGIAKGTWNTDVSSKNLERTFDAIKAALKPLYDARKKLPATLDMFTLARVGNRPIEETVAELMDYRKRGYFDDLCLSEVGAETIKKVTAKTKVAAVEIEFSLFVPDAATNGVFAICKQLDIPAVCYSPLGMGLLTENASERIGPHHFDRFKEETWAHNKKLVESINQIAAKVHLSPSKLSISYITTISGHGSYPQLIPIPGSTSAKRQLDNLAVVDLPHDTVKEIDSVIGGFERKGLRYNAEADSGLWN